MGQILAIDDEREHRTAHVLCRTYLTGMSALLHLGPWDELILDHDLGGVQDTLAGTGNGREMTGYDIASFLEEQAISGNWHYIPNKITVCTANGPGLKNIGAALDRFMDKKGPRAWVRRS